MTDPIVHKYESICYSVVKLREAHLETLNEVFAQKQIVQIAKHSCLLNEVVKGKNQLERDACLATLVENETRALLKAERREREARLEVQNTELEALRFRLKARGIGLGEIATSVLRDEVLELGKSR